MNDTEYLSFILPKKENFQNVIKDMETDLFLLKNERLCAAITNYGARIVSLCVKNTDDKWVDVVVGFATLQDYLNTKEIYHGAIIGRFANRIAEGLFELNGQTFNLETNNGPNHLHGGPKGFHDQVWDIQSVSNNKIVLKYLSPDGDEGYPGNLDITVTYALQDNDLQIDFIAITDEDTVLNLTNHAYFNLNGLGSGDIYNHQLYINAKSFTPIDETLIPTGEMTSVVYTPFDFLNPKIIGEQIDDPDIQIQYGKGYDHNFILDKIEDRFDIAARATGDQTGITLEVYTTEPGLQFYSGNFMEGAHTLKGGAKDTFRSAFCLETQHFPDSPNHPNFPSTVLRQGQTFSSKTAFRLFNSFNHQ